MASKDERGLRLLSLDGGTNGMPVVLTLKSLLKHILDEENEQRRRRGDPKVDTLPKPCEYFDLIGGSGSGGLLALMVGPLCMGIEDVEDTYADILHRLHPSSSGDSASRSAALEEDLKKMIERFTGNPDSLLLKDARENGACKIFVSSRNEHNLNANIPTLFRSYTSVNSMHKECKIWEAGRATTAMPDLFDPVEIGGRGLQYVGGSFFVNNPSKVVIEEAAAVFKDRKVACLVSVGNGHPETITLALSSLPQVALQIAMDCERTHEDMIQRFNNHKTLYHRFNVQQGLQGKDSEHARGAPEVESHTNQYLLSGEVKQRMKEVAKMMALAVGRVHAHQLLSPAPARTANDLLVRPPPLSSAFLGRGEILKDVEDGLFPEQDKCSTQEQKRFVLHGLGGSGKTQIAVKFIDTHRSKFTRIYLINASSEQTIENALENIGIAANLPEPKASDTLAWLCRETAPWLLLFDNADDTSVNLHDFFPPCSHGSILVTSRNREASNYAQPLATSSQEVLGMTPEESFSLLIKASRQTEEKLDAKDKDILPTVAKTLGHLPLALVQCGSYVAATHISFEDYLDVFNKRRKELLSRQSTPPVDAYKLAVYATWEISFGALTETARSLLNVCSFFHFDGITAKIFSKAAANVNLNPYLQQECFKRANAFIAQFLSDSEGMEKIEDLDDPKPIDWDDLRLRGTILELTSYSLMQHGNERSLSIHPLVQFWCQDYVTQDVFVGKLHTAQAVLSLSVSHEEDEESVQYRRVLVPHIYAVLKFPIHGMAVAVTQRFARDLRMAGHYVMAERLWVNIIKGEETKHGPEDLRTVYSKQNLGLMYIDQGRYDESEALHLEILDILTRQQGREHVDTVACMCHLAVTYWHQSQHEKAEALEQEVLDIRTRILGPEDRDTQLAMNNLASTYLTTGRYSEAKDLLLKVIEIGKRTRGPTHTGTLKYMGNLANMYFRLEEWEQAETLEQEVYDIRKRVLGPGHPDTLVSMNNLSTIYVKQGRPQEAEVMGLEVVEYRKVVLGPSHPHTIGSMNNLATLFWNQNRFKDLEALEQEVIEINKAAHGPTHPSTLAGMHSLAVTYTNQRKFSEARSLVTEIVHAKQAALGAEHPETVSSANDLEYLTKKLAEASEDSEPTSVVDVHKDEGATEEVEEKQ